MQRINSSKKSVYLLMIVAFAAVILFSPFRDTVQSVFSASASNTKDYFMGDVDFNGSVEPSDARTVLRAAVSLERLTGMGGNRVEQIGEDALNQAQLADVDGDKFITSADARTILRMAVHVDPLVIFDDGRADEETTEEEIDPSDTETTTGRPYMVIESGVKGDGVHACVDCGKRQGQIWFDDEDEYGLVIQDVGWSVVGGCRGQSRLDMKCPYCEEMVPAWTCHTCDPNKIISVYQEVMNSESFKNALQNKLHGLTIEEALTEYTITDGKEIIYLD